MGCAVLEVAGREVITLAPGSLLPEGAAAGKARLRVVGDCELYRFRRYDLDLAVTASIETGEEAPLWYNQYKFAEKLARTQLGPQVRSAFGVWAATRPHPMDELITSWSKHRREEIAKGRSRSPSQSGRWCMRPPEVKPGTYSRPASGARLRRVDSHPSQCWWPEHWRYENAPPRPTKQKSRPATAAPNPCITIVDKSLAARPGSASAIVLPARVRLTV